MLVQVLKRVASWLCLAIALMLGFAPWSGFVLCLEPDGTSAFEVVSLETGCGGCSGSGTLPSRSDRAVLESCPCVDIPVCVAGPETRFKPQSAADGVLGAAILAPTFVALLSPQTARPLLAVHPGEPRPSPALSSLRTVVLLV